MSKKNIMLISKSLVNRVKRIKIKKLSHQIFDIFIEIVIHSIIELLLTNEIHIITVLLNILIVKIVYLFYKKCFNK